MKTGVENLKLSRFWFKFYKIKFKGFGFGLKKKSRLIFLN